MLVDNFFDRLVARIKRSNLNDFFQDLPGQSRTQRTNGGGAFNRAKNIVINQSTFIENGPQTVKLFVAGKAVIDPALELIAPHTDPNATVDSSARFPPPLCHPRTRLQIQGKLLSWLIDPKRQWNMIWLYGPAGTGKSAVAQTFAEHCIENHRLGASFFFSRPNQRNDPNTVIPTLVYQLAVRLPTYRCLVTAQLANDPQLMWKARKIQFRRLIVEPFLQLQSHRRKRIRDPLLIVLDGLDECEGEDAQREIIEMIDEATRLHNDLPLLWIICSRPEAHLKHIFSQPDYTVHCGHEELAIDAESIADVNLYIRDGLTGIKAHFWDVTTPTWPAEEQVAKFMDKASGHFGFASTALRYIGDLTYATPMARLDGLLSFLAGVNTGTSNPLEALDALYARILREVPDEVLHTLKLILGHYAFGLIGRFESAQEVCNFLHIDQAAFYSALRKLHSVVDVPTPKEASGIHLRFYHASFQDYLRDSVRSDGFIFHHVVDYAKIWFTWYKTDMELFHTTDKPGFDKSHQHGALPDLKWVSDSDVLRISHRIASVAERSWWILLPVVVGRDESLLFQIRNFDFRYLQRVSLHFPWHQFVNKLWKVDMSNGTVRTEPRSEVDFRLLEYMNSMTKPGGCLKPATFPIKYEDKDQNTYGYYFLLGHGSKAVACWTTGRKERAFDILTCDEAPSKERIDAYQTWLVEGDKSDDNPKDGDDRGEQKKER